MRNRVQLIRRRLNEKRGYRSGRIDMYDDGGYVFRPLSAPAGADAVWSFTYASTPTPRSWLARNRHATSAKSLKLLERENEVLKRKP